MATSPFAWPGGKRALTKTLLTLIPEHRIYVEVFAGSAKLLFAKEPSRAEVLNDLSGEVTNFFRVCKYRTAELAERLAVECIHAGRFRDLRAMQQPECELERALRFYYLTRYSFGAKGEHFAMGSAGSPKAKPLAAVRETLAAAAERLSTVRIEQRDFAFILKRYDSAGTFFYLDPPYVDFEDNGRYAPMSEERRHQMFSLLATLKGKFVLSFDDHGEIRSSASRAGFAIRTEKVAYSIGANRQSRQGSPELLIANFEINK